MRSQSNGLEMIARHGVFLIVLAFSFVIANGQAQEIGHAGAGLALAQHLCSQCHAVQKGELKSPNPDSPPFERIASVPGMTATALRAALNSSHRTMPNLMLKSDEQADIIAYILSLK